uniref:Cilia- and flagella-associated protein 61 N-terminal domain-containing protein n=2 Tax=Photinus pyralis TaxID=7054 RepID=A0A1Y1KGI0_PHOPY
MITRHQNSGRQLIVAEYNDNAVAVLCLNEVLNEPLLNEEFELAPFYGLRKSHLDDNVYDLIRPSSITGLLSDGAERELTSLVNILQLEEAEASYGSSVEQEANHSDVDYFINVPSVDLSTKAASDVTHSSKTSNAFSGMMLSSNDYQAHLFAERKAEVDLEEECTPPEFPPFTRIPTPVYHGDINAFTLELAVSHPDHESETIPLLLQAAFECFPERDYCILSIPSTCPPFPLLNLFVRVAPRATSTYPHELYLLHRNSVLSTLETRQAAVPDIEEVQEFIENIPVAHTFIDNFLAAICEEDDFESYLLTSENKIVGVAVIRQENENEYLNNHYNVNEWINEEYHKDDGRALLIHLVLSPIFQRQSQFFLREILRLSDYTVLFYRISSADLSSATRDRPLCGILDYLFPLRPRHLPEFPNIRSYQEFKVIEKIAPFTVYLTTINLCTLRYIEINTKIVVIGSSDTALAFLMGLIHSPRTLYKANFSNVTVVSPHGLSYDKPNKILSRFFVQRSTFNYQHIQMDTLKTYVNEVNGVLTKIDRKNKCIVINEDSTLSYDLLFIMCGKQFQKPIMSGNKKHPISRFPENVFLINTQMDANNALGQLKRLSMRKCKSEHRYR